MLYNKRVSQEYSIAATEVLAILNVFSEETLSKIPKKLIDFFKEIKIKEYKIDCNKELSNIQITNKTKYLLAMIYRNYLCDENEKKEFDMKLLKNEEEYQNLLRQKYDPVIFKNTKKENEQTTRLVYNIEKNIKTDLIEYKEDKWYKRLLKSIIRFFEKDNK